MGCTVSLNSKESSSGEELTGRNQPAAETGSNVSSQYLNKTSLLWNWNQSHSGVHDVVQKLLELKFSIRSTREQPMDTGSKGTGRQEEQCNTSVTSWAPYTLQFNLCIKFERFRA